ncbi:MAG: DUF4130 domain-containing protein [Candidatus Heimdallarchaeota archaeon]
MYGKIKRKKVLDSLSRHKDITEEFFNRVKSVPEVILENVGNEIAKEAVAMSREVDADLHSHKAFLRPSISKHGILYAKTKKMKHRNEEELLFFFKKRFPEFIIILESQRGTFWTPTASRVLSTDQSLGEVLGDLESSLPEISILNDLSEENYQTLWENFAQSQIIRGRKQSKRIKSLAKKWKNTVPKEKILKSLDIFFS